MVCLFSKDLYISENIHSPKLTVRTCRKEDVFQKEDVIKQLWIFSAKMLVSGNLYPMTTRIIPKWMRGWIIHATPIEATRISANTFVKLEQNAGFTSRRERLRCSCAGHRVLKKSSTIQTWGKVGWLITYYTLRKLQNTGACNHKMSSDQQFELDILFYKWSVFHCDVGLSDDILL